MSSSDNQYTRCYKVPLTDAMNPDDAKMVIGLIKFLNQEATKLLADHDE